jgi:hypothetical protein
MAGSPITHFKPDRRRLEPLRPCMDDFGAGRDAEAEWPNNILSRKTVVYGSGVIARGGAQVRHEVDPDELALCKRLAKLAARQAKDIEYGLDTEGGLAFQEFFIAANADDPVPGRINEALIRTKFGGTIFPPATISVEPLSEDAAWWSEVVECLGPDEGGESDLAAWKKLLRWFRERPEFSGMAFVSIGDTAELRRLDKGQYPPGTVASGSSLPRLLLGLTKNGSLAGVFGHVVQT